MYDFFATTPRNIEPLLADELKEIGASDVRQTVSGVHFKGPLEMGYRVVLWSRLANSVLLPLKNFYAPTPERLYEETRRILWEEHMGVDDTFAVNFTSSRSQINHTKYGALRVKDAVVDQFRDAYERRPSIDLERPSLRINCHIDRDQATLSVDLSGSSLHRRAYRVEQSKAPLKENVAAAVLYRAKWPELMAEGAPLFDPMCGSGTLLIEGALMASDHAPGLLRDYFGFQGWRQHDEKAFQRQLTEAKERRRKGLERMPSIYGSDIAHSALNAARKNIAAAGLEDLIHLERRAVKDITPPKKTPGLLVTNAPYGERLGDDEEALQLHTELGAALKEHFPNWRASVLTGSKELGFAMNLKADRFYTLYNGSLEVILLNFSIYPKL